MKNGRKAICLYRKEMLHGKSGFSQAVDYITLRLIAFTVCYMWFSASVMNNTAKLLLSLGATGFISVSLDLINTLRLDRFIAARRAAIKEKELIRRLLTLSRNECEDIVRGYILRNPQKFERQHIIFTSLKPEGLQCGDVYRAIRTAKEKQSSGAVIFHSGRLSDEAREAASGCSDVQISFVSLRSALDEAGVKELSPTDDEADAMLISLHDAKGHRIKKAASAPFEKVRIRRYIFAAACLTGLSFFVEKTLYYRLMAAVCIGLGAIAWWLNANSKAID